MVEKEKAAALKDIEFLSSKLNNEKFVSKAPAKLVEEQRVKLAAAEEKLSRIEESLAALA